MLCERRDVVIDVTGRNNRAKLRLTWRGRAAWRADMTGEVAAAGVKGGEDNHLAHTQIRQNSSYRLPAHCYGNTGIMHGWLAHRYS